MQLSPYLNRFLKPAENKPEIGSFSQEHSLLLLLLCLVSLEIGIGLGQLPHLSQGSVVNLTICGMLLLNHLAFSFKWSPVLTLCLRVLAFCWLFPTLVLIIVFGLFARH